MNPAARGQRTGPNPSPKRGQAPADGEGIGKTVLISFVSAENAGRAPRNPVRSRVAMATGGNRLELGRVLALPGWCSLGLGCAPVTAPRDMAQAPAGCRPPG